MLVVVTGVSGTGKTTLGMSLSQALGIPFLDADDFHPAANIEKMSAGEPLTDVDRLPWLASLAAKLVEMEGKGGAVLACSALKNGYREQLQVSESLRWIHLVGDRDLIWQRMLARQNHYMKAGLLDSQLAIWEQPRVGHSVAISGTQAEVLEVSLHYLKMQN
uniref:gluconokinase n=1 Tax=Algoriphagus sp. TaxID=1872435 RepID=UPI004047D29D